MRIGLFLYLVLSATALQAQDFELTSINITVQNGLVGDNVYCAMQDDKGYIWFGTETGVSRYNGRSFENFYMSDGLADNEIFRIDQDSQGRIWFSAFNGQMSYYHKGRFHNVNNDSTLAAIKLDGFYLNIFEDSQQNIWLNTKRRIARVSKDGTVQNMEDFHLGNLLKVATFIEKEGAVWAGTGYGQLAYRFQIDDPTRNIDTMVLGNEFAEYVAQKSVYLPSGPPTRVKHYVNPLLDENHQITKVISKLHNYANDETWACTFAGAIRINKKSQSTTTLLKDQQVSHVLKDREGGYWFTTLGNGVFFVPSLQNKALTSIDDQSIGNVTALFLQDDVIWFGGNKATIGKIEEGETERWELSLSDRRSRLKRIIPLGTDRELMLVAEEALILKNERNAFSRSDGAVKTVQIWSDSLFVIGTSFAIFIYDLQTIKDKFRKRYALGNSLRSPHFYQEPRLIQLKAEGAVIDMEEYRGGILVSTSQGLYFLDKQFNYQKLSDHPIMDNVINDIKILNDSTYLLASSGFGTYLFKDGNWHHFSIENGMSSNINRKVYAQNDSTFWIATNSGVNRVERIGNNWQISSIKSIDGLLSEDVNDLVIHNHNLVAATSKGVSWVNIPDWQSAKTPPLVSLNTLLVDDTPWQDKHSEIDYGVRNITVNFDGLHFQSLDRLVYEHRLVGFDETWRTTRQNSLNFGNLTPGNYTFQVRAISAFGDKSQLTEMSFTIATPFWMTWWFISLTTIIILVTLVAIVNAVIRRNKRKQEAKFEFQLRIAEAERKALQSQLNPHFIFNSLNSIQNMVLDEDPESAYQYLAKFGKLIRRVLEFSDLSLVSLTDELETLRLYMDLENLRLNDKFDYQVHIEEGVNLLQTIPSMIIQPHIENSIWHGIMPLKSKRRGLIAITIRKTAEGLHFEVLDNGVGRKPMPEGKQKSMGTKIVNELVRKHKGEGSGEVAVEDLFDGNEASGTRVTIQLLFEHIAYD